MTTLDCLWIDEGATLQISAEDFIGSKVAVLGVAGTGKALALDTPLPTPTGWTTMGDVRVGDTLFDENGCPCRVEFVTEVQYDHACYAVTFSDGSVIVADAEHRWLSHTCASRRSRDRWDRRPGDGSVHLLL